jgi:chorismate synthase
MPLRFLTAGDSHGESLEGIIEGLPAGIKISAQDIRRELRRRSQSYGRSGRQKIETDEVRIVSGLWRGMTTGAPVALRIVNLGRKVPASGVRKRSSVPRPGHADLAGCLKYGFYDTGPISERASARSTAMRVAIGAVARIALKSLGVDVFSHVISIGDIEVKTVEAAPERIKSRAARSPVNCADTRSGRTMMESIDAARDGGYTLGGCAETIATGVPPGLGSHVEWDRKLDARLTAALMSIQSVKAVEIGEGIRSSRRPGTDVQDAIVTRGKALSRPTNRAGGIEGGISNGEHLTLRVYGKPIPTMPKGLPSFDMRTLAPRRSPYVRSDVCVVPVLGVISEAVVAWELLCAMIERFGGDNIGDIESQLKTFTASLKKRGCG